VLRELYGQDYSGRVGRAAAALRRQRVRSARGALAIHPNGQGIIYGSGACGGDVGDAKRRQDVIECGG
jgi:hypothetical protein